MKNLTFACVLMLAGLSPAVAQDRPAAPTLRVAPAWPSIPETFFLGPVRGLSVDSQDQKYNVWVRTR
jgi:hypothetical protein